jgi:hypothetical protein
MNSIITRKALIAWGHNPPPDLAAVRTDHHGRHIITWDDVMAARRKHQAERLQRKREWFVSHFRAYKLWVAYFDQDLMGGWQAMIEDWRGWGYSMWVDRDRPWLKPKLMQAFPLVLPLGSEYEQWAAWKIAFAKQFKRRSHDRRPLGVAYLWWDGSDQPRPISLNRPTL